MSKAQSPARGHEATVTPVGVDVGVNRLATVAPARADPSEATVVDGGPVREDYRQLVSVTSALSWAYDGATGQAEVMAAIYHRIAGKLGSAAETVLDVATTYPAPMLVLEDIPQVPTPLWEYRDGGDFGTWLLPAFQQTLVDRATDAGVPVATVDPRCTTTRCHECDRLGAVDGDTIRCATEDCPVDEVCRDRSAALSIARRAGLG